MKNSFILLKGLEYAQEKQNLIKEKFAQYTDKLGLATILVGDDPASYIYVQAKIKACQTVGINTYPIFLPQDCSSQTLSDMIKDLNSNTEVHGILVQLPLPSHINKHVIFEMISPYKDVDCFHPYNLGKLFTGHSTFAPATPLGIMMLLDLISDKWKVESKRVLIIGASNIVGKPLSILLLHAGATVTVAHIKTKNIKELCLQADLIVSAAGQPNLINKSMVRVGSVLIDVGMNRVLDCGVQKLVGDINFEDVKDLCFAITPVPGGVGPMTITALLYNLDLLYRQQITLS